MRTKYNPVYCGKRFVPAVKRTSDQTGPSKVVVFAEEEIRSLLDHGIHQSYKTTPWTFWLHVIFKIGIPLSCLQGLTSEGCESSGLDYIGSILIQNILTPIDSLQSSFLTQSILCPQNIWTSDCLQFSFDTDIMCSVKSFPRVESAL